MELNHFHAIPDPWGYENNQDDIIRREILLSEIPNLIYKNTLDIGCGQGFITKNLPGENIIGIDISNNAIEFAKKHISSTNISFIESSIFDIHNRINKKFDLIVITGVLYPQYIEKSTNLIYLIIDQLLEQGGILISVHINEWYNCQFPYLRLKQMFYKYRNYNHNLEIYIK